MNKENAKKIVESALDGRFDDNNFKIFISNLLKTPDLSEKPTRYENINEQFKAVISECLILGHYKDDQKNKIDILKVLLHAEHSLDKARTTQRNFISNYLKNSGSEAAIVAFITPELRDWRFSLVKLEYIIEDDGVGFDALPEKKSNHESLAIKITKERMDVLREAGWALEQARGYLLFPGTDHVEIAALLENL